MATKKPKSSNKSKKDEATKSKTTEKTAEKKTETTVVKTSAKKSFLSGFFAKKYDEKESVLSVFKQPKFYGALLGEVLGATLLALLFFALFLMGLPNIATYSFAVIALITAVYAFSGACLNPIITVGMMASRRMSVIRGVMYIISEIVGSWLGWMIFNGFHLAGGETAYDVPAITALAENGFWPVAMIELLGAIIIAFFFARGLKYKRSVFTFGAVVAGGMTLAILVGYVVSAAFLSLNNSFVMNPAVAMMLQIFPQAGENFGEIIGGICQALSLYAIIPMIGGVCGFYLSDFASKLSDEQ